MSQPADILASHKSSKSQSEPTSAIVQIEMDVYYKPDGGVKITCIYDNVADSGSQFCITWLRPEQAVELGVQLIKTAAILPGELAKIHESRAEKARRRQLARNEKNNTRQSPRA